MQEELDQFQKKLDEERAVSSQYGTGQWAYLRGVANMLARKGMWNRLVLVFCAFALNNLSGAAAINYYSVRIISLDK